MTERLTEITNDALAQVPDIGLREAIARAQAASVRRQGAESSGESQPQTVTQATCLPAWAEDKRGVPNAVLRSALFPAIQGRYRRYLKDVELHTQQGITIRFTGMQLDQADLDVWEHALHLARHHALGAECQFSARSFLRDIGRTTGHREHKWLKDSLQRLATALVSITHGEITYFGTFIQNGLRHEGQDHYWLQLNPNIVRLYQAGHWTSINWEQRQELRRKPLALWLHGFYASHQDPYPLKVETIRNLSGSQTHSLSTFKQNLKTALSLLQNAGAITNWHISNDLVHVVTPPRSDPSQTLQSRAPKT